MQDSPVHRAIQFFYGVNPSDRSRGFTQMLGEGRLRSCTPEKVSTPSGSKNPVNCRTMLTHFYNLIEVGEPTN